MAAVSTWIKVVFALVGVGLLSMCAIAGAGVYFVSKHVNMSRVEAPAALKQFEDGRARFKDQQPLIEIDANERVTQLKNIADLPDGAQKAASLHVMAWDPDDGRIVNFKIPLWVLGLGEQKVDLGVGSESLDLRRLNIHVKDLERIGPALLMDLKSPSGDRALIWTE